VIRSDNGPEYISKAIKDWAYDSNIHLQCIQPGNPQQNAYVERFNRTVRYEWLSQYLWNDIQEVQDFATRWPWQYNNERPNMALGGVTPKTAIGYGRLTSTFTDGLKSKISFLAQASM
jgi:putative transposase